ncbi:MAG TPA: isoprenylcysteine carboxylmethyltransferase family protein [Thermoanaerobaculia bacterium]|nr:isoprenylcysteine carboxylmethyltransferase family protein [Thermoanaerobaculia bacterium]
MSAIGRILLSLRAILYSLGFFALWTWAAVSVRPMDARLHWSVPSWLRYLGLPVAVLGALIAASCIAVFVSRGRGTPFPLDAPREFVATGPYRYVRNPMYIGGGLVMLGAGLWLRSPSIVGLAALFILVFHFFVLVYEEPTLEDRFGSSYRQYKASVNRWLPRLPA